MTHPAARQGRFIELAEEVLMSLDQVLVPFITCVNSEEGMFIASLKAALGKNYQVNRVIAAQKSASGAFTLTASLRGLIEDIISLEHIAEFTDHRDEIVNELLLHDLFRYMDSQRQFFKEYRPFQPLLNTRPMDQDIVDCKDRLKRLGYNQTLNLKEKANKVGLGALYDYLYMATSANVHFNAYTLFRMGWSADNFHTFDYSIDNFSEYYFNFNRIYGVLLFVMFCTRFASYHLNKSGRPLQAPTTLA